MQASAYIPIHVFQVFNLKEDVIFKINLNVLVECLCMFWSNINSQGSSVALQLFYKVHIDVYILKEYHRSWWAELSINK